MAILSRVWAWLVLVFGVRAPPTVYASDTHGKGLVRENPQPNKALRGNFHMITATKKANQNTSTEKMSTYMTSTEKAECGLILISIKG